MERQFPKSVLSNPINNLNRLRRTAKSLIVRGKPHRVRYSSANENALSCQGALRHSDDSLFICPYRDSHRYSRDLVNRCQSDLILDCRGRFLSSVEPRLQSCPVGRDHFEQPHLGPSQSDNPISHYL
jgi:hypothetical protein